MTRNFTIKETMKNIWNAGRGFVILKTLKKKGYMNKRLKEEIMLAVTEVNGCSLCSYVHTNIALSSGMTKEEIKQLLDGDHSSIDERNAVAVLFGQHFAYTKEQPTEEAINRLLDEYGLPKTKMIIAASYMITMTNAMGISLDRIYHRLLFKREKGSLLINEILIPLLTMLIFPIALVYFKIYCTFKNLDIPILKKLKLTT